MDGALVEANVYHALKAVSGLRAGRSAARESEPVHPVAEANVDAVKAYVSPQVWAMIELQRLTGMRPGEVVQMRVEDIDQTGPVWNYSPAAHKTQHHGKQRLIAIGPKAQAILKPWIDKAGTDGHLFKARHAGMYHLLRRHATRKTPAGYGNFLGSNRRPSPKHRPGECYSVASYRRAISRACEKAGVPSWHPHQLRHNAATMVRRLFGLDHARALLGHSTPVVTEIYAELDSKKAVEVVAAIG